MPVLQEKGNCYDPKNLSIAVNDISYMWKNTSFYTEIKI